MNDHDTQKAIIERINRGGGIPAADTEMMERWWDVVSDIPREVRGHTAVGLGAIAGPNAVSLAPEQSIALMMRVSILWGLEERGLLLDYLSEPEIRKRLFAAIASMPLSKDDFAETMTERILREGSPEEAQKFREEMLAKGLTPERPRIMGRIAEIVGSTP